MCVTVVPIGNRARSYLFKVVGTSLRLSHTFSLLRRDVRVDIEIGAINVPTTTNTDKARDEIDK